MHSSNLQLMVLTSVWFSFAANTFQHPLKQTKQKKQGKDLAWWGTLTFTIGSVCQLFTAATFTSPHFHHTCCSPDQEAPQFSLMMSTEMVPDTGPRYGGARAQNVNTKNFPFSIPWKLVATPLSLRV